MTAVVVADVHLRRDAGDEASAALARVVREHARCELVFAGDLFDLAAESIHESPAAAVRTLFARHGTLARALRSHVEGGGSLTLLAGNHDDDIATAPCRDAVAEALALSVETTPRVSVSPWFVRPLVDPTLHIEHGHVYDPDNALPHPLATPDPAWASLGIGLMRRFIAPMGIHELVHANDRPPLECLTRSFKLFGPKGFAIVWGYVSSAVGEVVRSGSRYPVSRAREIGEARALAFAEASSVDPLVLEALAKLCATPTLASSTDTFFRLYLDRVFALSAGVAGAASVALSGKGRHFALGAFALLALSIVARSNRYHRRAAAVLRESAPSVAQITRARRVIMGHAHEVVDDGAYVNTGSFGFPGRGERRPYLRVHSDQRVERCFE